MKDCYFIIDDGDLIGPVRRSLLRRHVRTGLVRPSDLVRLGDGGHWTAVREIRSLSRHCPLAVVRQVPRPWPDPPVAGPRPTVPEVSLRVAGLAGALVGCLFAIGLAGRVRIPVPAIAPPSPARIGEWIKVLSDHRADIARRTEAEEELGRIGAPAVPALVELLQARNPFQRSVAARVLGSIGPEAASAVPQLVDRLDDEFAAHEVVVALSRIGKPAVSRLASAVESGTPTARLHAIVTLGRIGPAAREAVPALRRARLEKSLADTAAQSLQAIERTSPSPQAAPPATVQPRPEARIPADGHGRANGG